ncbi:MAG: hypothetical protein HN368_02605, partial [Spirochaetales bacterium]|nr:hypothetical protein [Spirochaetales bacterium]
MAKKFYLTARKSGKKKVYYYRLSNEKTYHSTKLSTKSRAEAYVIDEVLPKHAGGKTLLKNYMEPYFDFDRCPHCQRLISTGKSITRRHASTQRNVMTNHVLKDQIVDMSIGEIRRGDVVAFQQRLIKKNGMSRTVQKATGILGTIMREAYFLEDIDRNPCEGLGKIAYKPSEVATFTEKELQVLFDKYPNPPKEPGIFGEMYSYTAFL